MLSLAFDSAENLTDEVSLTPVGLTNTRVRSSRREAY